MDNFITITSRDDVIRHQNTDGYCCDIAAKMSPLYPNPSNPVNADARAVAHELAIKTHEYDNGVIT